MTILTVFFSLIPQHGPITRISIALFKSHRIPIACESQLFLTNVPWCCFTPQIVSVDSLLPVLGDLRTTVMGLSDPTAEERKLVQDFVDEVGIGD